MGEPVRTIALVGNPNVGKSLIFSRITGRGIISANYPGTTVALKKGRFRFRDAEYELLDLPGIYSLEAFSAAEQTAIGLISEADIILDVIDATNLERNLNLTLQLLTLRKPMIACLNLWDETRHRGIAIDRAALEKALDVEVVAASALSGEGIAELVQSLGHARVGAPPLVDAAKDAWSVIGSIVGRVQKLSHRHHTPLELLGELTIHPVGGPAVAVAVLAAAFVIVRFLGEWLVGGVCSPLFSRVYEPLILRAASMIPWEVVKELLVGRGADPLQSFGILTTGVYISLVLVFPYFFSFYLMFGVLEDFGYLPRLAVVLDALFHRLGLHGYSSIPVMLGFGCKVPAFLATRALNNRREKVLTIALILMSAPCLPQSAMIFSLGMHYGAPAVASIFAILFIAALGINAALNRLTKGELPEFFMEIPPYRIPSAKLLARKLWTRILEYAREVFPMIVAGVLVIHVLDSLKLLTLISETAGRPLAWMLGIPRDIAPVLILGFLRKDVSIALLAPFGLSARQFVTAAVFMVLYVPCIASLFTLVKEAGVKTALAIAGLVFVCALTTASLLHGLFWLAGR